MSPERHILAAMLTTVLTVLPAGIALGQIDHRVNRGTVGGNGQALDANPLAGSGGLNLASPYTDYGERSNALITGNFSGLAAFKGEAAIPTGNGFRLSLPSSGLSSFQGRSVGIPDLPSSGVPLPTFYFSREQTISDLGYIRQGLNEPGSSTLRSQSTAPQLIGQPQVRDLSSAVPDPIDLRVDVDRRAQLNDVGVVRLERPSSLISPSDLPGGLPGNSPGGLPSPYDRAVDSSLFGIPDVRSITPVAQDAIDSVRSAELAGERYARDRGVTIDALSGVLPVDTRVVAQGADRTDTSGLLPRLADGATPESRAPAQISAGFEVRQLRPGEVPEDAASLVVPGRATLLTPTAVRDDLGRDKFADMTHALEVMQRSGVNQLGFAPVTPGKADTSEPEGSRDAAQAADEPVDDSLPLQRRSPLATAALGGAIKWAANVLDDPITTFAGTYADKFNQAMADGEQALRDGRYYDAERQFDIANTIDPENPLPLLHRGHALIAAGDFMSASRALQEGIRRFPQIAAFRIDLPAMAGKTTIFDIRRADLERSLERSDYYELRFLLGYLELYSGLPQLGIENLEIAAKAAPPDSVIANFVDLLLGRTPLPATR